MMWLIFGIILGYLLFIPTMWLLDFSDTDTVWYESYCQECDWTTETTWRIVRRFRAVRHYYYTSKDCLRESDIRLNIFQLAIFVVFGKHPKEK